MRPYVFDLEKQEHWKNCAESIYGGPIDKQLSTYNYFIKFVIEHGTYPSNKHTFTKYLSAKQANRKEYPIFTLPRQICQFLDDVFQDYEQVLGQSKCFASEFKSIVLYSRSEKYRIELEKSEFCAQ
uniref:Uncharacterized protein n=1 Tax=Ditylenchus dipsaci TaxID=166011 RepID=A0A915EE17_9BILA